MTSSGCSECGGLFSHVMGCPVAARAERAFRAMHDQVTGARSLDDVAPVMTVPPVVDDVAARFLDPMTPGPSLWDGPDGPDHVCAGTLTERAAALVAGLGVSHSRLVMTWMLGELARMREAQGIALEAEGGAALAAGLDAAGDVFGVLVVTFGRELERVEAAEVERAPSDGEEDE